MPAKPARTATHPRTNVRAGNASAADVQAVLGRLQEGRAARHPQVDDLIDREPS